MHFCNFSELLIGRIMAKIWSKLKADKQLFFIVLILVLGLIVRLIGISTRAIWYDEAFSLLYGKLDLPKMIEGTLGMDSSGNVADIHPLGYYFLLSQWMKVFGDSIQAARLLSILFGVSSLFICYLLCKYLLPNEYSLLPVFFLAISPFHIHYSQEIRMYALMAFLLSTATLALFKGMSEQKLIWWGIFAVSSALAQYVQQLSGIYLIVLAAIPLLRKDKLSILRTFLSGMAALILYLPWLIHLPSQVASTKVYWIEKPLPSRYLTLLIEFVSGLPIRSGWTYFVFGASLVILIFGVIGSYRVFSSPGDDKRGLWFAYLAFVPPMVMWLISQIRPVFIERALLTSGIMFVLWIGYITAHASTPKFEKLLLTALLMIGAFSGILEHVDADGFPYAPYIDIGNEIVEKIKGQEIVIHSNKLSYLPMYYYFGDALPQTFIADVEGGAADTLAPPTQKVLGISEAETLEAAIGDRESFYFLIFEAAIQEMQESGLEEHPQLAWMQQHDFLIECKVQEGDLWIYHFIRN